MNIRVANEKDHLQLAEIRWQHAKEDDEVYKEKNTVNISKEEYFSKFINALKKEEKYKIFIMEENQKIVSSMYVYMIPKIPSPNHQSKYIAYLTKVFTEKEYRNKKLATELLNYVKAYLIEQKCELIFVWPSEHSRNWYKKNNFSEENEIFECILMDE